MQQQQTPWATPVSHLVRQAPDQPILYFCPRTLQDTATMFQAHFEGLVTYAVKANDAECVLTNLAAAGLRGFDVASPAEMERVRQSAPTAKMHYNNPVRSAAEISAATTYDVVSWSVDAEEELAKLEHLPREAEIAVRFALPVAGAAYDFGAKFGANPEQAVKLLQKIAQKGFTPALCFHPGTQCADPQPWADYIAEAARISEKAGVRIARLNVGGGFASFRGGQAPDVPAILNRINTCTKLAFAGTQPKLVCEPGRSMVAEAFQLAVRIKAIRGDGTIFLNDGIYGGLADLRDMGAMGRVDVIAPDGGHRTGSPEPRTVFGPTCDSLDKLPDGHLLPADAEVGDYLMFSGMGAYSLAMSTRFNGYGLQDVVTVATF